jgi:rubrerythrin
VPLLLLLLVVGVFAYAWAARRNSTLTRACLWRQERAAGQWRCAACGAVQTGDATPRHCLRG